MPLPAPAVRARSPSGAGRGLRHRQAEATKAIEAAPAGIFAFEGFVDGLTFVEAEEGRRLKLAGGEIFDNLIRHAAPLADDLVLLRCARRGPEGRLFLAFYFRSPAFGRYAATSPCGRVECRDLDLPLIGDPREAETSPFFDPLIGRWRGIGLRMCSNLTTSLLLRAGSAQDRIYLAF